MSKTAPISATQEIPGTLGPLWFTMGFLAVVAPFAALTVSAFAPVPRMYEVTDGDVASTDLEAPELTYIRMSLPVATSLPKIDRFVSVMLVFAMEKGSDAADTVDDMIIALDTRLNAVLSEAIRDYADTTRNQSALLRSIPQVTRSALNQELGTPEEPTPVKEVLVVDFSYQ